MEVSPLACSATRPAMSTRRLVASIVSVAGCCALLSAAPAPAAQQSDGAPQSGVPASRPALSKPVVPPPKPDLTVPWFDIVPTSQTECRRLLLVIRNRGAVPLPDSAYAATTQQGGVSITVSKGSNVNSPPILSVMLVDIDPGKRVRPNTSSPTIGNPLVIELPENEVLHSGGGESFRIAVDAGKRVAESQEGNNLLEKRICCLVLCAQ